MAYAFILFGLLLTVAGVRGKQSDLLALVKGDFTGPKSFVWWTISIFAIGALGYVKDLRPFANAMLILVLLVLVLSQSKGGNGSVITQFLNALKSGTQAAVNATTPKAA